MIDFGAFCYLDVQKTGSTFVEAFLREHAALPVVDSGKHKRVTDENVLGDDKLFFISTRDPVALWCSLYFFGSDGKGWLARRVREESPHGALYDGTQEGLDAWLRVVLEPEARKVLNPHGESYSEAHAKVYGYQTHRFLQLSFFKPKRALSKVETRADVKRLYRRKRLQGHLLRNESLNQDLSALIEGPLGPYIKNVDAALSALETADKLNASSHAKKKPDLTLAPDLIKRIRNREWFFYKVLGYR